MIQDIFKSPRPFAAKAKTKNIPIILTNAKGLENYLTRDLKNKDEKAQRTLLKNKLDSNDYRGEKNKGSIGYDADGKVCCVFWGIGKKLSVNDGAMLCDFISRNLSKSLAKDTSFALDIMPEFKDYDFNDFCIGWGLAHYQFTLYKKKVQIDKPLLVLPKDVDEKLITASLNAIFMLRHLVNIPSNDLGTDELAAAAKKLADQHKAKTQITKGKKIETDFPMIHAVGKGSPRPPQLVDIRWAKDTKSTKYPKLTIVGKGLVYDTGGLNLKTGGGMRLMKKDMGGAAHALGLASMIMDLKLPVQLRVLLAIAENSTSGTSFRPGDILQSRKKLTVEIADTDAEGRLCVGDALTYACEEKPDLLIDFCTLTGSARVALGYDIPAFFTNQDSFVEPLRKDSAAILDPIWPLPLWQGYDENINSPIADVMNEGSGRGGAIEAALFLQRFIDSTINWVHLDCYAWEQNGKAGRPQGGADTGLRAMFDFIRKRYG